MNDRSSSTMLPPVRRTKRRDWGRIFARVLCVLFAVLGLVPASVGLLVRTSWARGIATAETRKVLKGFGVDATYDLELKLWPLSVALRNLRVEASDGGSPFLTARRASARPKIFGLLGGKVIIDQIEIDQPNARVVLENGKLANLALNLPPSDDKKKEPFKAPFSVVSASEAEVDVTVDNVRVIGHEIDADVTTDDDGEGGQAFEVAFRIAKARSRVVRTLVPAEGNKVAEVAIDDDVLCRLDARARIDQKRILVRRLSAFGAADLAPEEETGLDCDVAKTDKRYVEVALGHLAVTLPKKQGDFPSLDGHVKVRAPMPILNRIPGTPEVDGWIMLDAELRYTAETPIPDVSGHLEAQGIRVTHFSFARSLTSDFVVRRSIVTSSLTTLEIADGVAEIRDAKVQPLAKGIPIEVGRVDIRDVNFTSLMRDLGVSKTPHVQWDVREIHVQKFAGTAEPLDIKGDISTKSQNFAVYDAPVESPTKSRAVGVREGSFTGKVAITPHALEFQNIYVRTPHGNFDNGLVSIGYHEILKVEVPHLKLDLVDITPLGNIAMGGVVEGKVSVTGKFGDPKLEADASIQNFTIADLPFGNVSEAHASLDGLTLSLRDIKAVKGKSPYEMTTGQLDFGGEAAMRLDGRVTSKGFDIRDFFNIFKLDEDPRFEEIGGTLEASARMHLALGGPEDKCKGGYLEVRASTNARDLTLFGEKFDEGHADLEYRWLDQKAGLEGAEIDVSSLSLTKVKKEGRPGVGSVLGSLAIHRGGELRSNLVMQGLPIARVTTLGDAAKNVEGSISGVARASGTLSAWLIEADLDATPLRILGAPFGASNVHFTMNQFAPQNPKVVGRTPCGAPIAPPFDKEAYLRDQSVQGSFTFDGSLFGGQVKLDNITVTRQKAPIANGHVELARLDLSAVNKLVSAKDDAALADPNQVGFGGEISGDMYIEKIATNDIANARARFVPKALRVSRGPQTLSLRTSPSSAPNAIAIPLPTILLANDDVTLPPLTFDLSAPNGFKGAATVKGTVKKVTRGAELALDAELSPIDLGILVGVVPKVTHAQGQLSGSVKLAGKLAQPEFDGQLRVRGGELGVKGLPGNITDVEIEVIADENEARVTRATGHFLGGDLGLTARMPLKGGQLGIAEATLTGRQLYVSPVEGVKATVDADMTVSINPTATTAAGRLPLVGGEVTITSFEYTRPITVDLTGFSGNKRTVVESYDPSLDAMTLAFDVRSRVPLRIRNNLVEAQLAIDPRGIRVTGTNQRIGLRGELTTLTGGRFRVFANDFDVQKGIIRFDDPSRIAPHVDITATTEYRRYTNTLASGGAAGAGANTTGGAGGTTGSISSGGRGGGLWRITLHAYGDADDLKVDMTSDPALSREDIFFLLTIGLTRAEVDQVRAGSVYASAAFEAIGTVSGVDRAVKQAIPVIDDFRPGTAYSPRTGRVEPNITVGRRLGENVRARVTSGLAEDPQLRSTIEWRLGRSFTVEPSYDRINTVSSSNVGNFGVDFRWRLEFD
ncbi:MAG: translocation/assembly module TamB domain-containing protein [Deltaproteobacteria bacterium]|nr:translocation/assembly module TamB domain-containing protein [Deltaproteobacteria bacterium]